MRDICSSLNQSEFVSIPLARVQRKKCICLLWIMQSQQDERAKVRSALVDAHVRCLPRVQRKLLFGPDKPAHQATTLTEGINHTRPKRSCLLQFIKEHFFKCLVVFLLLRILSQILVLTPFLALMNTLRLYLQNNGRELCILQLLVPSHSPLWCEK